MMIQDIINIIEDNRRRHIDNIAYSRVNDMMLRGIEMSQEEYEARIEEVSAEIYRERYDSTLMYDIIDVLRGLERNHNEVIMDEEYLEEATEIYEGYLSEYINEHYDSYNINADMYIGLYEGRYNYMRGEVYDEVGNRCGEFLIRLCGVRELTARSIDSEICHAVEDKVVADIINGRLFTAHIPPIVNNGMIYIDMEDSEDVLYESIEYIPEKHDNKTIRELTSDDIFNYIKRTMIRKDGSFRY